MKRKKHTPEQIIRKLREADTMLAEARWFAKRRQEEHNEDRPHSALGDRPPHEFSSAGANSFHF